MLNNVHPHNLFDLQQHLGYIPIKYFHHSFGEHILELFDPLPSWTRFNIKTKDQVLIEEVSVGYLPTNNAPATEMNII